MLVDKDQIVETADHDFASITLVPTVVTIHDLPAPIDQSWYRGQPYVYIKINATEPLSALRNAAEIKEVLVKKFWQQGKYPSHLGYIYRWGSRASD